MNLLSALFLVCLLSLSSTTLYAEEAQNEFLLAEQDISVPAEVAPFIPKDFYPIILKKTDLNNDQLDDYLLVLENNLQKGSEKWVSDRDAPETPRAFIILERDANGQLSQVKRNDKIIYCRICGGAFDDPFESIEMTPKELIVRLYGGSNWRWAYHYEFGYSRIDKTWQLISVTEISFHTFTPDDQDVKIYKPPKDFGKIDLADFDPQNYLSPTNDKKDN